MKKILGVILALAVAVMGFALAETSTADFESKYALVHFKTDDGESCALIGGGDGTDAFEAFASEDGSYAERFEDFWKILSLLEPAKTVDAGFEDLAFGVSADGRNTVVLANGATVMEIDGLVSFAIVAGDGAESEPKADAACDVHVWNKNEAGVDGQLCANCGKVDDGSDEHEDVISEFCEESHTECMGNPEHHCDACGRDYVCSKSNSHTLCAVCGKNWCDKSEGNHAKADCGHRGCEIYGAEAEHEKCEICGGYLCDGQEHTAAECGIHHADEEGDHAKLECGHFACEVTEEDAENHAACENGDGYRCDGQEHGHAAAEDELPEGDVFVEGDAA